MSVIGDGDADAVGDGVVAGDDAAAGGGDVDGRLPEAVIVTALCASSGGNRVEVPAVTRPGSSRTPAAPG